MRVRVFGEFLIVLSIVLISVAATAAEPPDCDYNGDQIVDQADLDMINAAFNSQEGDVEYSPAFDHDGDGYITGSDIAVTVSMTTR